MIEALIIYSFMLFGSTLLVYWGEKCKYARDRYILYFISFSILFIPTAIRYDVGTDFLAYINIYNNLDNYSSMEPAFYYINKVLSSLNAPGQYSIAIFSFIFLLVIFISSPSKYKYIYIFIAMSLLMFISFNGIRQAISIAFSLLSLKYFIKKKLALSLIYLMVGALFHKSAIILLPFLLIAKIPLSDRAKKDIIPLVMLCCILSASYSTNLIIMLMNEISIKLQLEYVVYFNHSRHFTATSLGSGLGVLAKVLFSLFVILSSRFLLTLNREYWVLVILIFGYAISIILAKEIEVFGRLEQVFIITPIICSYIFFTSSKNFTLRKIIIYLYILFLFLSFYKVIIDGKTNYTDPKLNPYQTIFSEKYHDTL